MAVALRYNDKYVPPAKEPKPSSGFKSIADPWALDPNDFTAEGGFKDPAMGTQGGKYWQHVLRAQGIDPKGWKPEAPSVITGEGGSATGPAGDSTAPGSVSGFDPGIAGFGVGALGTGLGLTPASGLLSSGVGAAGSAIGSVSGIGSGMTASTASGPVGVSTNAPSPGLESAIAGALGVPGFSVSVNAPAADLSFGDMPDDMGAVSLSTGPVGNISANAGYTDPANITATGPVGLVTSPTGETTAPNGVSPGAGDGSGGAAAGAGAGGDGSGGPGGESPHTGGYIAGPGMQPGGFGSIGVAPVVQALMQLKQMMTSGGGPGGARRPSDDPTQQDGMGIASGGGQTGTISAGPIGDSIGAGAGEAFGGIQQAAGPASAPIVPVETSAPSGDTASDSGPGAGDAGTGDAGTGDAGDAGGVGNDGSSGDAGGAGGAFHSGGFVGEQDSQGGDVLARLQPGEFVVPRGPFAEMLREANPGLTKYGSLLTKSPIKNYVDPQQAAMGQMMAGVPWGAVFQGGKALYGAGKGLLQGPDSTTTDGPYIPSVQDAPENGGFPDPGQPNVPMDPPGNDNTPPSERQEPEPPAIRNEQGMQKLKKLMLEFA